MFEHRVLIAPAFASVRERSCSRCFSYFFLFSFFLLLLLLLSFSLSRDPGVRRLISFLFKGVSLGVAVKYLVDWCCSQSERERGRRIMVVSRGKFVFIYEFRSLSEDISAGNFRVFMGFISILLLKIDAVCRAL